MADVQGNAQQVHGTRAHDAPASDNPFPAAGRANSSAPSDVGDGDVCAVWTDLKGRVWTNVNTVPTGVLAVPVQVSASFTRPSDTTAYAAGDAVTNSTSSPAAITFDGCAAANGGKGVILGALMLDSANQSTKGIFELWLFAGSSAPTPDNDNAVFTPTDAELANLVAIIPLNVTYVGDATSGAGGNVIYESPEMARPFTCGGSVNDLFGLLVVRNAYTPVSAEVFTIILRVAQS